MYRPGEKLADEVNRSASRLWDRGIGNVVFDGVGFGVAAGGYGEGD